MRLGIDTGGTYTDAVILDGDDVVVAAAKALTTPGDLHAGIAAAVTAVLAGQPPALAGDIKLVGLSTTLATNALVEGRGGDVGLVMIGLGPESLARGGLRAAVGRAPVAFIDGGHDALGAERRPLDLPALDLAIERMRGMVAGIAVTGAFAVRNPAHEQQAAGRIVARTGLPVTLSSELTSRLDAPGRALTTFINARLIPSIARLVAAVERLLAELEIAAPLMVVRGDGALMAATVAKTRPIETVLSGPAASVVGAAHLCRLDRAVVSDVGGTTTDTAILDAGRPRLAKAGAVVGGHRTMVEAIDLVTTGLGGDSEVGRTADGGLSVGPRRVVPLALLAHHHPAVLGALESEIERGVSRAGDARFALRLDGPSDDPSASRSQARLLALLEDGPRSLEVVVDREHLAIPLDALCRQGRVVIAGFTPSDAAHVLGLQTGWSTAAAQLGARLEARKRVALEGAETPEPVAFARMVLEMARAASARALVSATWEASGGSVQSLEALLEAAPFANVLEGRPAAGPLALALALDRPVVAVGGPAALLYEGVPERLGSWLVLPPHYQFCNAIGAVVGDVVRHVDRIGARMSEDRLTLYLGDQVKELADVDAARAALEGDAREAAATAALEAGAIAPVVTVSIEEDRATLAGGQEIVTEIRVRATAMGRPRYGAR
jgi:N-methylhydantoinase A/oxoprolinase/acetone carboxylase beta subunit